MSNTDLSNSKVLTVQKPGKTYKSTMRWYAGPSTSDLAATSSARKEVLRELLLDMTKKSSSDSYRQYATIMCTYTIVGTWVKGHNYRIDNQMKLNLEEPNDMSKLESGPRLNIHYQIEKKSHAMVLVRMKPRECPPQLTVGLIDEDPDFGFNPKTVMGFIEDALKYSAEEGRKTYIEWTIKEVKRLSAGSGSRSCDWSSDDWEMLETAVAAPVVPVKSDAGVLLKQVPRAVVKKIPVIGFVFGLIFGIGRLIDGDIEGALDEMASGAVSCLLGPGTIASTVIDVDLIKRDLAK